MFEGRMARAAVPRYGFSFARDPSVEWLPVSLTMRVLALIGLFIALMIGAGATVMIGNARDAVRDEMRSALELGVALGRDALPGDVSGLSALGLRHLRFLPVDGPTPARSGPPPRRAPGWFDALIGVAPEERRVDVPITGLPLRIVAEPWDEIDEVWEDMSDLALTITIVALAMLTTAALAVDRALRPLTRFAAAVEGLRAGGFAFRFDGGGILELRRLGVGISALAVALEASERENRRLGRILVTAQDHERRDIARDIHDELGAALFGIKVDAGRIVRLTDPLPDGEAAERARSILATVESAHSMSRRILKRLRPVLLDHLPLSEALEELVGEWSRREPSIAWTFHANVTAEAGIDQLDEALALTMYRLIQEALVNALRHAQPTAVAVRVRRLPDRVEVVVSDNGPGLPSVGGDPGEKGGMVDERGGHGISGMAERVTALGGRLTVLRTSSGETEVRAVLPVPTPAGTTREVAA